MQTKWRLKISHVQASLVARGGANEQEHLQRGSVRIHVGPQGTGLSNNNDAYWEMEWAYSERRRDPAIPTT